MMHRVGLFFLVVLSPMLAVRLNEGVSDWPNPVLLFLLALGGALFLVDSQ